MCNNYVCEFNCCNNSFLKLLYVYTVYSYLSWYLNIHINSYTYFHQPIPHPLYGEWVGECGVTALVEFAKSRFCLHSHAQVQVHNHTQTPMMTHYQLRAKCQPSHTRLVSEKSCGFVMAHRGGCQYQTATTTE